MLKIFLFFIMCLQVLLYPLRFFLPKRRAFELGNKKERGHKSFTDIEAKICFEISSEGELEQIRPLLIEMLNAGEFVELVYCSDSVTHQCLALYDMYPEHLRLFRMPLLTYLPWSKERSLRQWKTAKTVALCRYDFFPELIWRGEGERKILFWGSLKSFARKSFIEKLFLKLVYQDFDLIFAATSSDKKLFHKWLGVDKVFEQDFRPIQILKRIEERETKIKKIFRHQKMALSFFQGLDRNEVDILGSYWPVDFPILKSYKKEEKKIVFIAPHKLEASLIEELATEFKGIVITKDSSEEFTQILERQNQETVFVIMNIKGFLCELYSYAGHAYVSGGFGRSVHSLLEPVLSGSLVVCGPRTHRSTEYDLIKENIPHHLKIASTPEEVLSLLGSLSPEPQNLLTWKEKIVIMNQNNSEIFYRFLERMDAKASL